MKDFMDDLMAGESVEADETTAVQMTPEPKEYITIPPRRPASHSNDDDDDDDGE